MHAYVITRANDTSIGSSDGDCFSLRVVIAIHRIDTEEHRDAQQHNGQHHHHGYHSHPDWNGKEAGAVVVVPERVVRDAKCLDLKADQ